MRNTHLVSKPHFRILLQQGPKLKPSLGSPRTHRDGANTHEDTSNELRFSPFRITDPLPKAFMAVPDQLSGCFGPVWKSSSSNVPNFLASFPPLVTSSPLDLSAPLVSSRSSALPPLLILCGSSDSPRASRSPAQHEDVHSPAPTQASRPMSLLQIHCGPSALGIFRDPSSLQLSLSQLSLCLCHGLPGLQLRFNPPPFRLHNASPSLRPPRCPHFLRHRHSLQIPRLRLGSASQKLHFGLPGRGCHPGSSASLLCKILHEPWVPPPSVSLRVSPGHSAKATP
ncbi:hypothetical protein DPX16_7002 [Anabarilius grahami]|uniref:Uncharacterized protein n=1 Tax=Anabarilius grahami TaxID=495550 RepID=A0A3N0Z546_ANAGA|nr:hypothetical protein DPX16_7002 [Anabarilius grahami]